MLPLLLALATLSFAHAGEEHEPIQYFERYKPSFFLLGRPITKAQFSFKVQVLREFPLYFGYSQLMMWDLFEESAPFRDFNFSPEVFYRIRISTDSKVTRDLDLAPFLHESNGTGGPASRSWNRAYLRYTDARSLANRDFWWSLTIQLPYGMDAGASKRLPECRGLWEFQVGASELFHALFEVNELVLRVYGGGKSRVNPIYGGQELTYREKASSRALLLPLYLQIFHGYGENLLDAEENRWGLRAGIGF